MKRSALVLLMMLAFLASASHAGAQDLSCPQFSSDQIAAQAYFDENGGSATNNFNNMDANGNGVACDEPGAFEGGGPSAGPEGGPSAGPEGCADFASQAEAQTYFENSGGTTGDDLLNLDANGNGVACDDVAAGSDNTLDTAGPDENAAVVSALPSTGSGAGSDSSGGVLFAGALALMLMTAGSAIRSASLCRR